MVILKHVITEKALRTASGGYLWLWKIRMKIIRITDPDNLGRGKGMEKKEKEEARGNQKKRNCKISCHGYQE